MSVEDLSDTLCKAALFGNKEMLESLLQSGVDPNVVNAKGNSPLHEAAHHGETECASLLLAHRGVLVKARPAAPGWTYCCWELFSRTVVYAINQNFQMFMEL